jgi:hypothetical protein
VVSELDASFSIMATNGVNGTHANGKSQEDIVIVSERVVIAELSKWQLILRTGWRLARWTIRRRCSQMPWLQYNDSGTDKSVSIGEPRRRHRSWR